MMDFGTYKGILLHVLLLSRNITPTLPLMGPEVLCALDLM